jgi:two-component system phosphate regulon response regulator PhoB
MARVLVIEDETAIAELVAINLRHAGFEAVIARSAEEADQLAGEKPPDLALVDWMLPGRSGLNLLRQWRAEPRTTELPLIMLTARSSEAEMVLALEAGADDYVTKPFSIAELMARVRSVLRRRAPQALDLPIEVGALFLDPATRRVRLRGTECRVGPTEFRLLRYLMAHPERVHTRAQLLKRVWGEGTDIEERTVDAHIKRLRSSLAEAQGADMVETVRGIGYRLAAP